MTLLYFTHRVILLSERCNKRSEEKLDFAVISHFTVELIVTHWFFLTWSSRGSGWWQKRPPHGVCAGTELRAHSPRGTRRAEASRPEEFVIAGFTTRSTSTCLLGSTRVDNTDDHAGTHIQTSQTRMCTQDIGRTNSTCTCAHTCTPVCTMQIRTCPCTSPRGRQASSSCDGGCVFVDDTHLQSQQVNFA